MEFCQFLECQAPRHSTNAKPLLKTFWRRFCAYGPPVNAAFSTWSPSHINCLSLTAGNLSCDTKCCAWGNLVEFRQTYFPYNGCNYSHYEFESQYLLWLGNPRYQAVPSWVRKPHVGAWAGRFMLVDDSVTWAQALTQRKEDWGCMTYVQLVLFMEIMSRLC